eukprot:6901552-Pyramimonas_sp.AAC.1
MSSYMTATDLILTETDSESSVAFGVYSAGIHRNRFGDMRRVRLSDRELGTRSAARTRSAKLF